MKEMKDFSFKAGQAIGFFVASIACVSVLFLVLSFTHKINSSLKLYGIFFTAGLIMNLIYHGVKLLKR
jgi:hypothetical protein